MKRLFFVASIILIFLFMEIVFSTHFNFLQIKPDLLLLAVVFFTVYLGLTEGILSAITGGIFKDVFSVNSWGVNLLIFMSCALLISYFKKYIYRETAITIFTTALIVSLLNAILNYFISFSTQGLIFQGQFLWVILPEIILTAIFAPVVFFYLKRCALRFSI